MIRAFFILIADRNFVCIDCDDLALLMLLRGITTLLMSLREITK